MDTAVAAHNHDHGDFDVLRDAVQESFLSVVNHHDGLFTTDATDLFDVYLNSFGDNHRQWHNCNACRRFLERFGGLVTIDEKGRTTSIFAETLNGARTIQYHESITALIDRVSRAKVTGVFRSNEKVWGTPRTGDWSHFALIPPISLVHRDRLLTPYQSSAAIRERVKTVRTALLDFKPKVIDEALRLLKAEALARSEKFVAPLEWLRKLYDRPKGLLGENILWLAVATAPEGFTHPRTSVTGTLLEDIAAGLGFEDVRRKFNAKLDPREYQRPQAAPSAGNIKAAEAIVEKLGIASSLERRFARIEDLRLSWSPKAAEPATSDGGIFGHLKSKGAETIDPLRLPTQTMTWEKFARTILPSAEKVSVYVPSGPAPFIALTTAVHADAPPIIKWDHEEERNPVSMYVYPNGSYAPTWGVMAGTFAELTGICDFPNQWGSRSMPELFAGVVLLIKGAKDSKKQNDKGNALFPECLKGELHQVRATIEAYSQSAMLSGYDDASACGLNIHKAATRRETLLRVTAGGAHADYRIDRWD